MKRIVFVIFLISSLNAFAQNFFIPNEIKVPPLPSPTLQIEWADVDLNGFPDLITAEEYTHELVVYPNTAGVVDSVPFVYPANMEEFWLTDWNHDNRMDVIGDITNTSGFQLILNNPAGGFFPPVTLTGIPGAPLLQVKDLNADNFPDLIFKQYDSVYVALNLSGSATLNTQAIELPVNGNPLLSDLDNDGDLDLLLISQSANQLAVIYENTGSYNFSLADTVAFSNGTGQLFQLHCYDLNNDGKDEILATSDSLLSVAQNISGFQYNEISRLGFFSMTVSIKEFADIDNNGFKDLIVFNSVLFNTNATLTKVNITMPASANYLSLKCTDANNDGIKEIWWNMFQYSSHGHSYIYSTTYNTGTTFHPVVRRWNVNPIVSPAKNGYTDFDNDGDRDFLYHSAGRIILAVNDSTGNFNDLILTGPTVLQNTGSIEVVDVDQDGLPDILQESGYALGDYWITYWRNNGNYQFQSVDTIVYVNYPHTPQLIAHEDFDNDGIRDFVFANAGHTGIINIEIVKNNVTSFTSQGIIYTDGEADSPSPIRCEILDFDNNGFKDIFFDYESGTSGWDGRYAVLLNSGGFVFTNPVNVDHNDDFDNITGLSDINGDGIQDLIFTDFNFTNQTSTLTARINNNDGTFGPMINVSAPLSGNGYDIFSVDVNNDGLNDAIRVSDFGVFLNNGSGYNPLVLNGAGTFWTTPEKTDIDGDGDMDLLFGLNHTWFENTAISSNKIVGTVFYDVNQNGVFNVGDIPMENYPVGTNPFVAITNTDTTGQFIIRMGGSGGTYYVESRSNLDSNFIFTTVPYPDSATVNSANPVDTVNIGFYTPGGLHQATLDQSLSGVSCNRHSRLWFNTTNFSPLASAMDLQFNLPPNVTFSGSLITPTSQSGNLYSWNWNASAFENKNFWIDVIFPNTIGDTIQFLSTLYSTQPSGTIAVVDTITDVVTCSFDPNDKQPLILSTQLSGDKLYAFDDYIEYVVRFQNTGTDTAYTVVIKDQLSNKFDLSTFGVISASDDFSFNINGSRLLTVTFNNIELPDSGTNFTGSMGYVKFAVRLNANTQHNVVIRNSAKIYFDQNAPVNTNVVDIYRVDCRDFITPVYSSTNFCSGSDYSAYINSHGLDAHYTWSLDGNVIANNDSSQFTISHTGNNVINIHIDLGVCQYDSVRTFNVTQTAAVLTLSFPADTSVCPNQFVTLNSNLPSDWYLHGTLFATNSNHLTAMAGDTVVVIYTSAGCVSIAQSILHSLIPIHESLLTDSTIHLSFSLPVCVSTNLSLSSWNNVHWEWWLNTYPAVSHDTSNTFSIFIDSLATHGYLNLSLDTLGCHYAENYTLNIVRAATDPLIPGTDTAIICPGTSGNIYFNFNLNIDSLQVYHGMNYDTTIMNYLQGTSLALMDTGVYTVTGYSYGCIHPSADFIASYSTATFPVVNSINNILFTSDGMDANWYYSTDSINFSSIGVFDSLYFQPDGYYYFDAFNADSCLDATIIYHYLGIGIRELEGNIISMHYDAAHNQVSIPDLPMYLKARLIIFNSQGQIVYRANALPTNRLPVLVTGIYMAMLETGGDVFVVKMMVGEE